MPHEASHRRTACELAGHTRGELHSEARDEFGAVFGSRLIHAVLDAGAPGSHLYTFNKAKPVLDILALLGVTPDPQRSGASTPDTRA